MAKPLPLVPLGRSGITVSRVGFGSAPLGDFFEKLDEKTAIATVEAAFAASITLVDTSPHYGNGLAEHRIGTALRTVPRDSIVISTKIGRVMQPRAPAGGRHPPARGFVGSLPHKPAFDYSYDGVMRSLEQSLLRLGTDRIDILLVHDIDAWSQGEDMVESRYRETMDSGYRALDELRSAGVVKAIGLGLDDHDWCERFLREGDFDAVLLAGRYSLLEQPALATLLPLALEKGVGIMLGGIFNSGILATGAVPGARYNYEAAPPEIMERVAKIEAVCRSHGVPLARAAVQFALGHPAISTLVLGAVQPAEIARNLSAIEESVPAGLWSDLKTEGLLDPAAPAPKEEPAQSNLSQEPTACP
ncbi:aldo/keto reductase [Kaistia dalseonensis]|uniref:D-threo-aldose 1-dehydrogenase n=1 Tax=Kaistia dalseonensis TaxID=410840 RepID=A0ABU0H3P3_9HYPH|nr:aldo/keto reductase [Kaistia dalseonensis]MCX5494346.1 aldo/keto reductase [Kaistia dalseonensis]MDQ0436927.1 D-threo-aldose 1-dehydrogenase [Kaistia dalseonensis]